MREIEKIEEQRKQLQKRLENYLDYFTRAKTIVAINTLDWVLGEDDDINFSKNKESLTEEKFYEDYYMKHIQQKEE